MSVAAIIARYSLLPEGAVKEWPSGSVEDIESAIVFVLALWSGPSIAAFGKLTSLLANTPAPPPILVCDIDNLSSETTRLFGKLRGVGETFWIRDGQVVASLWDYTSDDCLASVERNSEMLRAPRDAAR
jgi:hypothetical protein